MNFRSASDASKFVDAIRHVCPCKVNPPAAPTPATKPASINNGTLARAMTMEATSGVSTSKVSGLKQNPLGYSMPPPNLLPPKQALRPSVTMQPSRPSRTIDSRDLSGTSDYTTPGISNEPNSRPSLPVPMDVDNLSRPQLSRSATYTLHMPFADDFSSSAAIVSARPLSDPFPVEKTVQTESTSTNSRILPVEGPSTPGDSAAHHLAAGLPPHNSAAMPLMPFTSDIEMMPPPPVPPLVANTVPAGLKASEHAFSELSQSATCNQLDLSCSTTSTATNIGPIAPDKILSSLREIKPLYDLPRPELERLVAHVIREEGFVNLVRAMYFALFGSRTGLTYRNV